MQKKGLKGENRNTDVKGIKCQVENKAWKPGVARPSKSKARWVNTTNKMQVSMFECKYKYTSPNTKYSIQKTPNVNGWTFNQDAQDAKYTDAVIHVSGFDCGWSQYNQTASKQQRCSQVLQFTPYLISSILIWSYLFKRSTFIHFKLSFQVFGQRHKRNRNQRTKITIKYLWCDLAPYKFMYKRDDNKGMGYLLFSLNQRGLVEGEVGAKIPLEVLKRRWRLKKVGLLFRILDAISEV